MNRFHASLFDVADLRVVLCGAGEAIVAKQPETDEEMAAIHVGGSTTLHNATVSLDPYDPAWPQQFEAEAAKIRAALGSGAFVLEHVGSTSIPGLCAKPILDIVLAVADSGDEAAYVPPLEAAGYQTRPRRPRLALRPALRQRQERGRRSHHGAGLGRTGEALTLKPPPCPAGRS
jgi:GrpB-like predicted nucleotidyltransferase (UPF0157 family)